MTSEQRLAEKRLLFLLDVVGKYNATNRSIDRKNRCVYYNGKYNMGCAIGDAIEDKTLCKRFDAMLSQNKPNYVGIIFDKLPVKLQKLGKEFLVSIQTLHDNECYWNSEGLSDVGVREANWIYKKYIEKDLEVQE